MAPKPIDHALVLTAQRIAHGERKMAELQAQLKEWHEKHFPDMAEGEKGHFGGTYNHWVRGGGYGKEEWEGEEFQRVVLERAAASMIQTMLSAIEYYNGEGKAKGHAERAARAFQDFEMDLEVGNEDALQAAVYELNATGGKLEEYEEK